MKLLDLRAFRQDWTGEQIIYVTQPWSCDADALVSIDSPDTTDSIIQSGKRYEYFLEGFIARDFLEDLGVSVDVAVDGKVCARLIRYAIDDA